MGVGRKSFHLLAVGVIRVRVASEAVEVPQLQLLRLFFGSLVFKKATLVELQTFFAQYFILLHICTLLLLQFLRHSSYHLWWGTLANWANQKKTSKYSLHQKVYFPQYVNAFWTLDDAMDRQPGLLAHGGQDRGTATPFFKWRKSNYMWKCLWCCLCCLLLISWIKCWYTLLMNCQNWKQVFFCSKSAFHLVTNTWFSIF